MRYALIILRFGWPYLRRYWLRLFLGVALGVLFGLSNAVLLSAGNTLLDRLNPSVQPAQKADHVVSAVEKATPELEGALKAFSEFRASLQGALDPWLPLAGRPITGQQVLGVLLLLPLLVGARGFIGYFSSYLMGWVSERVINDLRLDVLIKLNSLSLDFFNRSTMGDLMTRVNGDTAALHRSLSLGFSDIIKEPVTIAATLAYLCYLDWKLMLFTMIILPTCVLPFVVLGRKLRRAMAGTTAAGISQSSLLVELLSSIRIVKAFNLEDEQVERFRTHSKSLVHHGMKSIQARELMKPIIETLAAIAFGLLIVWIFHTGRGLKEALIFLAGVVSIYTPIKKLSFVHMVFQQSSVGVERLVKILQEQPSVKEPAQPKALKAFNSAVTLENVTFSYGHQNVVKNVSLTIPRGFKLGVAGENGSGKSTLVNLFFRFYDPTQGAVKIDGLDLREISTGDLRRIMALVSQDVVVFDTTVAQNIAYGKFGTTASRDEIEAAARAANAHEFITHMPQGYDTRVGERGVTLSGGQRQRLAIARAFIRNAPILVLDEATAALDSHTEAEVQAELDKLAQNRTVICVAHRLSTLANTDRIIVLSQGEIIEQGTFNELLKANGTFAAMAARQGIFNGK
ncbi:MAG: ABC transporter ATP-binding protein [Verrucomicrobia bacterium]|nr:ABC transporter ATP-binding protein [Verrucomicrobiota bacterium]